MQENKNASNAQRGLKPETDIFLASEQMTLLATQARMKKFERK
ncbi:hypothetical protein [Desulfovibrio sp. UIB00]|nr:hypothetical protein [Desulfovibrio sp. UIB00]